jgi:hypothetical protein
MLNVSCNELVGRIPDLPHFSAFSNLSFLGNTGLYGIQVSKACDSTTPHVELQHSDKKDKDLILQHSE